MSTKHGTHWLEREDLGDVTVVRLKVPRLEDEDTVREVFDPIVGLIEVGRRQLVLNLATVKYAPSLVLGKLVMLNRKAQAAGGRLVLCGLAPSIARALETTHLSGMIPSCDAEEEAVASFAAPEGE
jgi:anti-sigma B factor antagonist